MNKPRKKFTGALAEPLKPFLLPETYPPTELQKRLRLAWIKQKFALLREHYGLRHTATDAQLLVRIVHDFVPGFRVDDPNERPKKAKRGRPRIWTQERRAILCQSVALEVKSRNRSAADACYQLAKREPWKSLLEASIANGQKDAKAAGEALRSRYVRAIADKQPQTYAVGAVLGGRMPTETLVQELESDLILELKNYGAIPSKKPTVIPYA